MEDWFRNFFHSTFWLGGAEHRRFEGLFAQVPPFPSGSRQTQRKISRRTKPLKIHLSKVQKAVNRTSCKAGKTGLSRQVSRGN